MSRVYKNPPVIEALCEFQFAPGQPWDWTVPGLVYAKIKKTFPDKQEQKAVDVMMEPNQPPRLRESTRLQFFRHNKQALVQIGPDLLVINHLRPYPTWDVFREMIYQQFDIYRQVAKPDAIKRITLRYINRLDLPSNLNTDDFDLSEYCLATPGIPRELLHSADYTFAQRVDIRRRDSNGSLTIQSGSAPVEKPGYFGFGLDFEYATLLKDTMPLDAATNWIEQAHEEIEKAFDLCYTERAKALFDEGHND